MYLRDNRRLVYLNLRTDQLDGSRALSNYPTRMHVGIVQKETNINKNNRRVPFSKKETPSFRDKFINGTKTKKKKKKEV